MIVFESGDLIDGSIAGWPASFIATDYRTQGWALHVAPYTQPDPEGGDDLSAPEDVFALCDQANDKFGSGAKLSKADVRAELLRIGFVPDAA